MKTIIALLSISFAFFALATEAQMKEFEKMTPEQKEEFRRQRRESRYRKTGGKIQDTREQRGRVVFLNAQNVVKENDIASIPLKLSEILRRSIVLKPFDKSVTAESVFAVKETFSDEAVVIITQDSKLPSLLVAPESGYAVVNISAFKTDDSVKMALRTRREMIRAFAFLCAADATTAGSVLDPVKTAEDIDDLVGEGFNQDTMIILDRHLSAIGVKPYTMASYRKACEEGWAPAPTNDVQKAIWEQVHAMPNQPIQIKFDPKKGR